MGKQASELLRKVLEEEREVIERQILLLMENDLLK